jgi:hypothetical protein
MRRQAVAVVAVLATAGALAGCSTSKQGTAGPPVAVVTVTATTTTTATATATKTATPKPIPPATPTLGPSGFGALKLGMTLAQAEATHLLTPVSGAVPAGCDGRAQIKSAPKGTDFTVLFSPDEGLAAINAWAGVKTPQGIHIGSSVASVHSTYHDWVGFSGDEGRGYAAVPGNSHAVYRIEVSAGKVVALTLQLAEQDCYE